MIAVTVRLQEHHMVLFATIGFTFSTPVCKTSRVENSSVIGAICLHFSAALEHRCRRSDATAGSRSLKDLLQVKPNKEVFSFLSSHQNITRRAAAVQMFPHRVSLKFKLKIFG